MNDCPSNIILINGPTGSGKTLYIRRLGATPANTLTSEQLVDELLQMCRSKSSLTETATRLSHITYIENMESLAGRPETQRLAAELIALMASKHRIILTSVDFANRLPFLLETLKAQGIGYVWKIMLIEDGI